MGEYIKREEAKETVKYIPYCDWKTVGDWLDEMPAADVVEVVRCKDCKQGWRTIDGYVHCSHPCGKKILVKGSDFCSYGERRDE